MRTSSRTDDRLLGELITESQDLQVDAMRTARETTPDLAEAHRDIAEVTTDPGFIDNWNKDRRRLLRSGGLGMGALAEIGRAHV